MPVYLDKKRGTYYFSGTFINAFGENEKYFVRGFSSSTAAKKAEREYLIKARTNPNTKYRFNDLIIKFLDYKKERVKPRTISNYTNLINKQLLPYFGKMYVNRITVSAIEEWQSKLLTKGYVNNYLEKIQTTMSAIMRFAVRRGMILINPLDVVEQVKNPDEKKKEMLFWTYEQYCKFKSILEKKEDIILFDLLYWTGMRCGEMQARTWNDVDFESCTLKIHNTFDNKNKIVNNTTKTGENRTIYLNKILINELKEWYAINSDIDGFNNDCYIMGVFVPVPIRTITNRKNKYIKKYNESSNDKIPEIRIHDFRHSHVSLLINNGVTSFIIAERLGHSKDMVERVYSHMFPDKRKEILDVLDKF